jgi:hypothetical protein
VNPEMGARNVEPDLERNLSKNLPWGLSPRFP